MGLVRLSFLALLDAVEMDLHRQDVIISSLKKAVNSFKIPRAKAQNSLSESLLDFSDTSSAKYKTLDNVRAYCASTGQFENAIINYAFPRKKQDGNSYVEQTSSIFSKSSSHFLYSVTFRCSGEMENLPEEYILQAKKDVSNTSEVSNGHSGDELNGNRFSMFLVGKNNTIKQVENEEIAASVSNAWLVGDECCVVIEGNHVLGRIESINYTSQVAKIGLATSSVKEPYVTTIGELIQLRCLEMLKQVRGGGENSSSTSELKALSQKLSEEEGGLSDKKEMASNEVELKKKKFLAHIRGMSSGLSTMGDLKLCKQHLRQFGAVSTGESNNNAEGKRVSFDENDVLDVGAIREEDVDVYSEAEMGCSSICSESRSGDERRAVEDVEMEVKTTVKTGVKYAGLPEMEAIFKEGDVKDAFAKALMAWYEAGYKTGYAMGLNEAGNVEMSNDSV